MKRGKNACRRILAAALVAACVGSVQARAEVQSVQVTTARSGTFQEKNYQLDVKVPHVSDPSGGSGAECINKAVDQLTGKLVRQFAQQYVQEKGRGHRFLQIDYETVTNTDTWFALQLTENRINGSSSVSDHFYNLDRATGKLVCLGDLFCTKDFGQRLRQEILKQVKEPDWKIPEISRDHNFYLNEKGQLVLPFDQYEIAPGSAGSPRFTISPESIRDILKPQYRPQ